MLTPGLPTISTHCANSSCVEVTYDQQVQVRDAARVAVVFDVDAWRLFAAALKNEELIEENAS